MIATDFFQLIPNSTPCPPSLYGKKGEQDSISPLFVKERGRSRLRERLKILSEVEGGELIVVAYQ